MEIIALDVGKKRTGIARASAEARLAEPFKNIDTSEVLNELEDYLAQHQVEAVVIGLPRGAEGQETEQTNWVRDWAKRAKDQIAAPFYWQDEFLTSQLAEAGRPYSVPADDVAASIILEDFLNTDKKDRLLI